MADAVGTMKHKGWIDLNQNGKVDDSDEVAYDLVVDENGTTEDRRVTVGHFASDPKFGFAGQVTAESARQTVSTFDAYKPEDGVVVVGVQDRWNATNERTIDGQDSVFVEVTKDGKTSVEEISVSQYMADDRFQGSGADKMLGLKKFDGFSLQNRPVTMSLPVQKTVECYTAKILAPVFNFFQPSAEERPEDKKGSGGSKEPVATV